ncbi:MAG: hypothetical protein ACK5FX_00320 [Flavobacteriia bacterium]|jgi:hypothetical protein
MIKLFLLNIILLSSFISKAQEGVIEIKSDPRIELLVKKQGMPSNASNSPQISGFRIQITFDPERKTIDEARERFISVYPTIDTYVIFNAPNYFLKVGDFRTQLEAEKIKDGITRDFPTSFIIKEQINLPRIDQQ